MLKPFPIKVLIFKKYGNVLKPVFDRGRYERQRIKTADGFIENNYLILKREKVKIPAPEIQYYYDIDGVRWLYLLQIDRWTFYPLSFNAGKMIAYLPIYETDKNGNPIKDENGKPKIKFVPKVLFDSTIALEDGRIVELPNPIAHKTYDKEHWLSNEIETAQRLYRSKSFWEKYGNFVTLAVVGILLVMFFYIGVSRYAELTKTVTDGLKDVSNAMVQVADSLRIAAQQSTQTPNVTKPPY